jgi:hypothetical protein
VFGSFFFGIRGGVVLVIINEICFQKSGNVTENRIRQLFTQGEDNL